MYLYKQRERPKSQMQTHDSDTWRLRSPQRRGRSTPRRNGGRAPFQHSLPSGKSPLARPPCNPQTPSKPHVPLHAKPNPNPVPPPPKRQPKRQQQHRWRTTPTILLQQQLHIRKAQLPLPTPKSKHIFPAAGAHRPRLTPPTSPRPNPHSLARKYQPLNTPPQNLYARATLRAPEPIPPSFSSTQYE